MSKKHANGRIWNQLSRLTAGLLALVLLCGLLPLSEMASAASPLQTWAQPYLDQLVEWGVMRGDIDGNLAAERDITRAEFVTLMNRAYGYDETGPTPFRDVPSDAWYADDIGIAYTVGYFSGTTDTTASPGNWVTREQAVVLLARNMMLQPTSGETLGFSDSREFSEWSRGLIGAAVDCGLVMGYEDGTFKPTQNITRGEVASLIVRAVGNLVNAPGEYSLGSVYGNVTINSSNVTLQDTVIAGDLYLTGGIGLGNVLLQNVTVLGKIVTSGAGESNSGESSVILRNVSANEMVVDSINNQFVTVRSEGDTSVPRISVRTNAYVEDTSPSGFGLKMVELSGETGTELQLAGNIKEVINFTPGSRLIMAQGSAEKVTVDEAALTSTLRVDNGARIKDLNLDVGTNVSGSGDVDNITVSADGSNVEMLPDNITIRPGVTANIAGSSMDNVAAAESSADPRLLAGYPAARDVAPTTATLAFSTNKPGTVYWAVSALADGSVSEEDVISPPSYGGIIVASGSVKVTSSKTEYTAKVSKLISDGSYYITAVMVDSRGQRSPLKVTAFTTPDSSTPAFATGYPIATRITSTSAQFTIMTTKSCQLYYAVLPKGSAAPKAQDFKANAITGNLGYGMVDAVKNSTMPITVNSVDLEELVSYDLYFWMTDYDGAKSSSVIKKTFTTVDETPPVIEYINQTGEKATSVEVTFALNEPGTLYWAVVKRGDTILHALATGEVPELTSLEAKIQVEAGLGAIRKGSTNASKPSTDVRLTISGLAAETAYDIYYIAKDKAGNYSEEVKILQVNTLDTNPPKVTQEFSRYNGEDASAPMPDSDIRLVFNESVQGVYTVSGVRNYDKFIDLYDAVTAAVGTGNEEDRRTAMANALKKYITMYRVPVATSTGSNAPTLVPERTWEPGTNKDEDWVIDYRYAAVTMEDGKMVITFPTTDDLAGERSALNMESGATYYFHVEGIADTAIVPNVMGSQDLPRFRTVFAQVSVTQGDTPRINSATDENGNIDFTDTTRFPNGNGEGDGTPSTVGTKTNDPQRIDMDFIIDPISITRVDENQRWDLLIWTDTSMAYSLYSRPKPVAGQPEQPWEYEGSNRINVAGATGDGFAFRSLGRYFRPDEENQPTFGSLQSLEAREFAIHVDEIASNSDYTSWNQSVTVRVMVVAGTQTGLGMLAMGSYLSDWNTNVTNYQSASIGLPDPLDIKVPFTDSRAPNFRDGYPVIDPSDITADVNILLDRPGTVYYVAVPLRNIQPSNATGIDAITGYTYDVPMVVDRSKTTWFADTDYLTGGTLVKPSSIPGSASAKRLYLSAPSVETITNTDLTLSNSGVKQGELNIGNSSAARLLTIDDLQPDTYYLLYLATKGTAAVYSDNAQCYLFKTQPLIRPIITMYNSGDTMVVNVDRPTVADYILVVTSREGEDFHKPFFGDTNGVYNYVDPDKLPEDATERQKLIDSFTGGTGEGGAYTILDAMCEDISGQGTVFDVYASETTKTYFASMIRNSSSSGTNQVTVMDGHNQNFNTGDNSVTCTGMDPTGGFYTFLLVGRSARGRGDAFRAYRSVVSVDQTKPQVISVDTGSLTVTNGKVNGTMYVQFNTDLHYINSAGTIKPLDDCTTGSTGHANSNYESVSICGPASGSGRTITILTSTTDHGKITDPIREIAFTVTNASDGATITLNNLCGRNGNRATNSVTLRLKVTPVTVVDVPAVMNPDGTVQTPAVTHTEYEISVIIPAAWDARETG